MAQHSLTGTFLEQKYHVLDKIGHGSVAEVYRAYHVLMDRMVAVKVLHPHLVADKESRAWFRTEARVASKLSHHNAVVIYDYGIHNGVPYLVMKLAEGTTLRSVLEHETTLSVSRICRILLQVCRALQAAHSQNIVHRDLKPENIIVTASKSEKGQIIDEHVEVLDFGIAQIIDHTAAKDICAPATGSKFYGTPRYAAPEQILCQQIDGRADIYAVGAILYEALSGKVPFDGPSPSTIFHGHLFERPQSLESKLNDIRRRFGHHLPSKLLPISDRLFNLALPVHKIIDRCLAKEPADRFASAAELAAALEGFVSPSVAYKRTLRASAVACSIAMLFASVALPSPQLYRERPLPVVAAEANGSTLLPVTGPQNSDQTLGKGEFTLDPLLSLNTTPADTTIILPIVTPLTAHRARFSATYEQPRPSPKLLLETAEKFYHHQLYLEAIPFYRNYLKVSSNDIDAILALGACYLMTGERERASKLLSLALQMNAAYAPVHLHWALYYAVNGDIILTAKELNRAKQLLPSHTN